MRVFSELQNTLSIGVRPYMCALRMRGLYPVYLEFLEIPFCKSEKTGHLEFATTEECIPWVWNCVNPASGPIEARARVICAVPHP